MPTGSGGGLAAVQTNTTLSGSGTAASPLSVANWPLNFFSVGSGSSSETLTGANVIDGSGFVLPYTLTFSKIAVAVNVADAVNNSDIGLYTQAGVLVAHVGPLTIASTGLQSFSIIGGAQTIKPGLYATAWTSAATTLQLGNNNTAGPAWFQSHNIGTAVSGTLPASISAITIAPAAFQLQCALF